MRQLGLFDEVNLKKTLRLPTLSDSVDCILLFLAGRASLLGAHPFALAMFGSVFDLKIGYLGILSTLLAYISIGEGTSMAKHLIAMIFFWLYSNLKNDYKENTIISSIASGCMLFVSGCIMMIYIPLGTYDFIILAIESIICAFSYVLFKRGGSLFSYSKTPPSQQTVISACLCVGVFITGTSGIKLPYGIEFSRIASSYAVMCIAMHESLAVAGSGGLAAGLVCSLSDLTAITIMGLYGMSGMFSCLLKDLGKFGVALGFLGGATVTLLYVGNNITISVAELAIAALLFILTPNKAHNYIGTFFKRTLHQDITPADVRMKDYLTCRLSETCHTYAKLASVFRGATEKRLHLYNRDVCKILDETSKRICNSCPNSGECWGDSFNDTYRIVFSLLEVLEKKGACNISTAPREFINLCKYPEIFLLEFSHVYELYKRTVISDGEYMNNRNLILKQYEELSEMFGNLHDTISSGFKFLDSLEEKVAEELLNCGISLREVKVVEDGVGCVEVYLSLNRKTNNDVLSEKISNIINTPMRYSGTGWGGLLKFLPMGMLDVELGQRQVAKSGEIVSGDSLLWFRTDDYKFHVIICDGMGSGSPAGYESRISCKMLEEFIKSGFSPKTSINMVNSSLALMLERESFCTIDLLTIDLMTGQGDFYKIGGSKSYIKRDNNIETVFSESLPIGILSDIHIANISKKLQNDDVIIMMSDGVCDSGFGFLSGERMKKLLNDDQLSMDETADKIIEIAMSKPSHKTIDDMTVVAIKIKSVK